MHIKEHKQAHLFNAGHKYGDYYCTLASRDKVNKNGDLYLKQVTVEN